MSRGEVQLFLGLQRCANNPLAEKSTGPATAFEIFRFHNEIHIRDLHSD